MNNSGVNGAACFGNIPCDDGNRRASAWPWFAFVYDPLTSAASLPYITFTSSVARGGAGVLDWDSTTSQLVPGEFYPGNGLYAKGIAAIDTAMAAAEDKYGAGYDVVFGGILWHGGPGGLNATFPYDEYRDAMSVLLDSVAVAVEAKNLNADGWRFYLINTVAQLDLDYSPHQQYGHDLEADMAGAYAFCSVVHGADGVRAGYDACPSGTPGDTCRYEWHKDSFHWGPRGLSLIGRSTARVAVADGLGEAVPWELGVEAPTTAEWCPSLVCPEDPETLVQQIRVDVYDDDTTLVRSETLTPGIASPDWRADFDGDDPEADWDTTWSSLSTDYLTVALYQNGTGPGTGTLLGRYVYVPTAITQAAGGTGFYRPTDDTRAGADADAVLFVVSVVEAANAVTSVSARSGAWAPSGGASGGVTFEERLGSRYVVPYNHGYYEAACTSSEPLLCPEEGPDFFLARLPDGAPAPLAAAQTYAFSDSSDVLIESDWGTSGALSWAVPGLTLAFPAGRRLLVEADLSVEGAVFTEAESGSGWGGLAVYSPGSLDLDAVTVEKAEVGIEVNSDGGTSGNVFTDVLLDANGVGILTGYDCVLGAECGGAVSRSAFAMTESCVTNSVFEQNQSDGYGIWARHTDATVSSSDVAGNDAHGLFLDDADLSAYRLRVEGNGVGSSARDGARVLANGDLLLTDLALALGENLVEDNGGTEVSVATDGYATIGLQYGGRNHVAVGADTSGALIDNAVGNDTLRAAYTYWGTGGPPPAWKILGPVDTSHPLAASPSDDTGHPADCVGAGVASAGGGSFQEGGGAGFRGTSSRSTTFGSRTFGSVSAGRASAGRGTARSGRAVGTHSRDGYGARAGFGGQPEAFGPWGGAPRRMDPEGAAWLADQITDLRRALAEQDDSASLVGALYRHQRLDRDDEIGEHAATMAALDALHGRLVGGASLTDGARAASEAALVGSVHDALRHGRYDHARTLLAPFGAPFGTGELPAIDGDRARWALGLALAALDEGAGETAEAVARIEAVLLELGPEDEPLAADLRATLRLLTRRLEGEGVGGGFAPPAQTRPGGLPVAYALGRPYPNPFGGPAGSGATSVPFALPEGARVEVSVFDLLGRRVAVLAEGTFPAGRHVAVLEGRGLASGLYLVRAVMEAEGRSVGGSGAGSGTASATHAFTRRVTLIRR